VADRSTLRLRPDLPVRALNAGLFVSRGQGIHVTRTIDSHEMIFTRSGVLGMFEEDRRFEVRAGEALHLWPGRRHGGTLPYPADLSFYWLHFRMAEPASRPARGAAELVLPQHVRVGRPDRLTELLRRFLDDQESGRLTVLSGALLVTLMLEEASGAGSPAAGVAAAASGAEALAARADEFILTHFHEPVSAWDVAGKLGCNPDYLGRVYRRMRRITLTEAINRARLRHARKLLMDSNLNVDGVARAAGFSEAGYFRRVFQRGEGVTPSAFRRSYARMHMNTE
jgi:AraC-like DNA-binding protein